MSNKNIFSKQAITIAEQIQLLKSRNLIIQDHHQATHFLKTIGYYRLMAYFKPFLVNPNASDDGFKPNVDFSNILNLYSFDRELRILVTDALERIEVALRASISDAMSIKYGAHWYLQPNFFSNSNLHAAFINEVTEHLKRSKEGFILNYYDTYHHPVHPPSWMVMECLSFGTISKVYSNLKDRSVRKVVGDTFGQYSEVIKSWMKTLTYTRNLCAHHARLWNRFFINKPQNIPISYAPTDNISPFYMQAYIIIKLLNVIAPNHHWKNHLSAIFEKNQAIVQFKAMGFADNWQQDNIWNL